MANTQYGSRRSGGNDSVFFDLMEHIGVIGSKDNGWTKEVNIVAWNGGAAKIDVREWDPSHERMTRGITLFEDEAQKLARVLCRRYGLQVNTAATAVAETCGEEEPDADQA